MSKSSLVKGGDLYGETWQQDKSSSDLFRIPQINSHGYLLIWEMQPDYLCLIAETPVPSLPVGPGFSVVKE